MEVSEGPKQVLLSEDRSGSPVSWPFIAWLCIISCSVPPTEMTEIRLTLGSRDRIMSDPLCLWIYYFLDRENSVALYINFIKSQSLEEIKK